METEIKDKFKKLDVMVTNEMKNLEEEDDVG